MRMLRLALFAASAAVAPLSAQAQPVPDPDPSYGLPNLGLSLPASAAAAANAGTSWSEHSVAQAAPPVAARVRQDVTNMMQPNAGAPMHVQMRGPMTAPPGARMQMRRFQGHPPMMNRPPMAGHRPGMGHDRMMGHRPGMGHGQMMGHNPMNGGHRFTRWQRINRGAFVPRRWWGPQFNVRNWSLYGFPQPMGGGRWIRYYDDALLIDRDGRVLDGRYGWDWDRYGDRWDYNDDGVPMYGGDDDYGSEEWDDEWAERQDGRGYGPPPPPPCTARCRPGPGVGYGYGYGSGAVVVTTTTTVTEAPVVETRTVYETVVERVRAAPRHRAKRGCACRVAPPPRPGERG